MREERAQIEDLRSSIAPLVGRSHRADERHNRRARSMRSRGAIVRTIASLVDRRAVRSTRSRCAIASLIDRRVAIAPLVIDSFSFAGFWFLLPDLMHFAGFWLLIVDDFFLGCGLCFSGFVFSFFFSKHQKIFSGKFVEMQPNTWKHFPFPDISI